MYKSLAHVLLIRPEKTPPKSTGWTLSFLGTCWFMAIPNYSDVLYFCFFVCLFWVCFYFLFCFIGFFFLSVQMLFVSFWQLGFCDYFLLIAFTWGWRDVVNLFSCRTFWSFLLHLELKELSFKIEWFTFLLNILSEWNSLMDRIFHIFLNILCLT